MTNPQLLPNQRPIKFRAWLKVEGKYQMTYDLAFEDYEPINDLLASVKNLMQFTNLKDKNGVEIYEGDILKNEAIAGLALGAVEFIDGGFWIMGIHNNGMPGEKYRIVIGNIYQNPELLNPKGGN